MGTFEPTVIGTGGNPSVTYALREGHWYRLGDLVFAQATVRLSAKSGGGGTFRISGLPFAARSAHGEGSARPAGITIESGRTWVVAVAIRDTNEVQFNACGSGVSDVVVTTAQVSATASMTFNLVYRRA